MLITAGGLIGGAAIAGGLKLGSDLIKGSVSNHFAEKRARDQALLEYEYARRYAENSPSWQVQGLRDAGLNPILAASGGFSAPNWKPSSPSIPDTSSGDSGFHFDPLTLSQIDVNKATIRNLDAQAKAAKLNSISQAKEREANTTLRVLEAEQRKNANFSSPIVRDAETVVRRLVDTVKDYSSLWSQVETDIRSSFINNSPSRITSKPIQDRSSEVRSKVYDNVVDGLWKSKRKFDGKPVYRKRGDVGGNMSIYR